MRHVLVQQIGAGRGEGCVGGNGRRRLAGEGPVGEQRFQLLQHLRPIEVTADCHHKVRGMKPTAVEALKIVARDRVHGGLGRIAVGPEILAKAEEASFARFDGGRIVVPLLHALEHLLFAQRDFVLLKARRTQRLAQDGQPLVQVL